MKYPQLVSTRAVSAISDWLVTQLEQLGVDASLVYSRLLLSLLHTPLQINALDLAEISEIKVGTLVRSKINVGSGNNYRRFSAADTEALKRLAAIDSLLEAVSSDQKLSKIETLIDELSEKLREIERQNHADDSMFNGFGYANNDDVELNATNKDSSASEDPAKRYYRAFPALSTQLADDNRLAINNCVSWPRAGPKLNDDRRGDPEAKTNDFSLNHCNKIAASAAASTIAEPKRKPKRKRAVHAANVMSSTSSKSNSASINESGRNRFNSQQQQQHQHQLNHNKQSRKKSPTSWDTEFDGAWEMGRDLIREFIMKQNNRNRSCSESVAKKFVNLSTVIRDVDDAFEAFEQNADAELKLMNIATAVTSNIVDKLYVPGSSNTTDSGSFSSAATLSSDMNVLPFIDDGIAMIFGSDECATPETLSSLNEADCSSQRRLYEREVSLESINRIVDNCNGPNEDCVDDGCDETKYLAAFEAKFNRNVEALWNNAENEETAVAMSLPPSNNAQSFWHNYYKHHYNASDGRVFDVFSAQVAQPPLPPQSLPPTMGATSGALGLTSSIWTDNAANNEDDVSFYANAKLWEKDYSSKVEQPFNDDYQNADNNFGCSGSDFTFNKNAQPPESTMMMMMIGDNRQMHTFDDVNMLRWSDNSTEKPFMSLTLPADLPEMQNEEKIRRDLFENSYFNESASAPPSTDYNTNYEQLHSNASESISSMQFCEQQPSTSEMVMVNKVTLANHSSRSGFTEVEPKQTAVMAASITQITAKQYQSQSSIEEENLLTSERTHFRPIKQTYPDGHSFDISDELDEICYERSASGTMYLDSEVYREYYVYDEEGNGGSHFQSGDASDGTPSSVPFILKYCVKQNEKSCQTDVMVPQQQQQQPQQIVSNVSMTQLKKLTQYRVTQVYDMPNRCVVENNQPSEIVSADEYLNMQGWSLAESRKKCNNNNNNAHALWEHCAACSNDEVISMPANRLLKDELSADGDEIMTDLKYMQNLYIGSDWEDEDESDAMADDDVDDDDGLMLPIEVKLKSVDKMDNQSGVIANANDDEDDDGYSDTQTNHIYYNVSKLISDLLQPEKARTLVQAISEKCTGNNNTGDSNHSHLGRLTINNNNIAEAADIGANNSGRYDSYLGGLWDNNDNSIWRKEPPNKTSGNCISSIWSTSIEYDANMNSIENGMANKNYEHLKAAYANTNQWEYANLEKIWTSAQNTSDMSNNANQHRKRIKETNESTATATLLTLLNDPTRMQLQLQSRPFDAGTDSKCMSNAHHEKCPDHTQHAKSRYDRKRRHSATSQNAFEHQINGCAFANCDAADRHKKLSATNIITCRYWTTDATCFTDGNMDTTTDNDYDHESSNNNNNNNRNLNHNMDFQQQCFLPFGNQYVSAGINAPLHPTSLLKHVAAMVARPLTR